MPDKKSLTPSPLAEGVTQFQLDFNEAPPLAENLLSVLNAWRRILYQLGLNGRDPARYGGLAYGNVSQRIGSGFAISGTQTGGIPDLTVFDYSMVSAFDIESNTVKAEGPLPPSSEAMTHGAAYQAHPDIQVVLHAHAPMIWQNADALDLQSTESNIGYGTPAMALAIGLFLSQDPFTVLVMGGHEDGVLATGRTPSDAAHRLLDTLARALALPLMKP